MWKKMWGKRFWVIFFWNMGYMMCHPCIMSSLLVSWSHFWWFWHNFRWLYHHFQSLWQHFWSAGVTSVDYDITSDQYDITLSVCWSQFQSLWHYFWSLWDRIRFAGVTSGHYEIASGLLEVINDWSLHSGYDLWHMTFDIQGHVTIILGDPINIGAGNLRILLRWQEMPKLTYIEWSVTHRHRLTFNLWVVILMGYSNLLA